MHWTLRILLAPATLIVLGVLIFAGGVTLTFNGFANRIPERAHLTRIAGTVQGITRLANRRQGEEFFVRYEVELNPRATLVITEERLASMKLDATKLNGLNGKPIEALVTPRTNYEIWEFSVNGEMLQAYDERAAKYYRAEAGNGPLVAGGGILLLIVGLLALRFKQLRQPRSSRA